MDFLALAADCAPQIHPTTMTRLVSVESAFNPFAIGVVKGRLERQPRSLDEAVATVNLLDTLGYNYSLGMAQVNKANLSKYGLSLSTAFQPCANLQAGAQILHGCYETAKTRFAGEQAALGAALSCYYSGNFSTGFKPDSPGQPSYVQKVIGGADPRTSAIRVIPAKAREARAPSSRAAASGRIGNPPAAASAAAATDSALLF
jgi:type IV secretion system protein VirB1